jgi:hypothetical protein
MEPGGNKSVDMETVRTLRHDIRNQLSGMILCIEQLKFELADAPTDQQYYMTAISEGCTNIDKFLDGLGE